MSNNISHAFDFVSTIAQDLLLFPSIDVSIPLITHHHEGYTIDISIFTKPTSKSPFFSYPPCWSVPIPPTKVTDPGLKSEACTRPLVSMLVYRTPYIDGAPGQ